MQPIRNAHSTSNLNTRSTYRQERGNLSGPSSAGFRCRKPSQLVSESRSAFAKPFQPKAYANVLPKVCPSFSVPNLRQEVTPSSHHSQLNRGQEHTTTTATTRVGRFPHDSRYDMPLGGGTVSQQWQFGKTGGTALTNKGHTSASSLSLAQSSVPQRSNTRFESRPSETTRIHWDNNFQAAKGSVSTSALSSNIGNRENMVRQNQNIQALNSSSGTGGGSSKLSLVQQKKEQWAKERDEQAGLWTPWATKDRSTRTQIVQPNERPPQDGSSNYAHLPDRSTINSYKSMNGGEGDYYLPPINDTASHLRQIQQQRSYSLIPNNTHHLGDGDHVTIGRDGTGRKASLPDNSSSGPRLLQHEHRSTYHKEGNAEWMTLHSGHGDDNGGRNEQSFQQNNNSADRSTLVVSPRVIVHKISLESSRDKTIMSRAGHFSDSSINTIGEDTHHPSGIASASVGRMARSSMTNLGPTPKTDRGDYHIPDSSDSYLGRSTHYGGSTGYLNNFRKPPPPAMRSSLTIGLESPRTKFGSSFAEIERMEKDQWRMELDQQREEQMRKKQMEKDADKRAKWGDKGVGVGHFWEPSDISRSRLPSRDYYDSGDGMGSTTSDGIAPSWLQRSLEMQGITNDPSAYPVLYDGPLPSKMEFVGQVVEPYNHRQQEGPHDAHHIHVSNDQFQSPRSRAAPVMVDDAVSTERTLLTDPNVPVDPNEIENQKKLKERNEYLEAVKQQIEDNKRRKQEEKEKQDLEDRKIEKRMEEQMQKELQRLEDERQKKAGRTDEGQSSAAPNHGRKKLEVKSHGNSTTSITRNAATSNPIHHSTNSPPIHESPLIPHTFTEGTDAYEMAITRRQVMTLTEGSSVESISTTLSIQDNMQEVIPHHNGGGTSSETGEKLDQCVMTDTDHIYERQLTPTTERRSRSMDTARSREFGTQTEVSDATDVETDREHRKSPDKRSKSNPPSRDKSEEKPRWGANPDKKTYLKQSEKDITSGRYQIKRKKQKFGSRRVTTTETDTANTASDTYTDQHEHSLTKIGHESRSRSQPFPAFSPRSSVSTTSGNHNLNHYGSSRSHVSSHLKSETGLRSSDMNFESMHPQSNRPSLARNNGKQTKGVKVAERKVLESINRTKDPLSSQSTVAEKHLGQITNTDGLNSVGTSEESGSGSTTPSIHLARAHCSTGDSNKSSVSSELSSNSSAINPEYVPIYGRDFITQRDFDEMPLGKAPINMDVRNVLLEGRNQGFANKTSLIQQNQLPKQSRLSSREQRKSPVKSHIAHKKVIQKEKTKTQQDARTPDDDRFTLGKSENESESSAHNRTISPPVPSLQKILQHGYQSHAPTYGIYGSMIPPPPMYSNDFAEELLSCSNTESRISSAEPKVDIDIAITHVSNPDLQKLMMEYESARSGRSLQSLQSGQECELLPLSEMASARSATLSTSAIGSRPVTNATDLSVLDQENFINELMNQKEVKEKLSARGGELHEKGIIEFSLRLPTSRCNTLSKALTSARNRSPYNPASSHEFLDNEDEEEYLDPLLPTGDGMRTDHYWRNRSSEDEGHIKC